MGQKTKRNYGKMTAEELSAAVNLVRSENSGVFGVKDIRSAFKQLGVPIHMNKVAELMTITRKKVAAQARKYNQKKKAVQQGTWVEQPKETTENGYRVSKPVLIYEEVTVK